MIIDFNYYEFMATTRLGYTQREFAHAYIGEILHKMRAYKVVFNLEKFAGYELEKKTLTLEEL